MLNFFRAGTDEAVGSAETRADRKAPAESVEHRVARMRERLAEGGEIAQGVVRELFPAGI